MYDPFLGSDSHLDSSLAEPGVVSNSQSSWVSPMFQLFTLYWLPFFGEKIVVSG